MLLGAAAPVRSHGEIQGADPANNATVPRAPRSVAITFTEAPTAQAVLKVRDGCGRSVDQGVDIADATATVRLAVGQPGRWHVSYNVISALDGHQTRGGYAFTVRGQRDCDPDDSTPAPDPTGPGGAAAATDDGDGASGSGAPVVPIALGAAAVLVLALIIRRSGSS